MRGRKPRPIEIAPDDLPPDEASRARLRKQALDWLRAELKAWQRIAMTVGDPDRPQVAKTLDHWKSDPDLAGLRDEAETAKLPEAEREACRALWREVDRLLTVVGGRVLP